MLAKSSLGMSFGFSNVGRLASTARIFVYDSRGEICGDSVFESKQSSESGCCAVYKHKLEFGKMMFKCLFNFLL